MKALLQVIMVLLVGTMGQSSGSDTEYMKAALTDQKGNTVTLSKIEASTQVKGKYKGQVIGIPVKNLKRIENIGNGILRVTNLKDDIFMIENATIANYLSYPHDNPAIKYWVYSEIDMEEKKKAMEYSSFVKDFHTLALSADVGRLKYNPRTKQYFPPDYIYDPFTGDKLAWKTPGQ